MRINDRVRDTCTEKTGVIESFISPSEYYTLVNVEWDDGSYSMEDIMGLETIESWFDAKDCESFIVTDAQYLRLLRLGFDHRYFGRPKIYCQIPENASFKHKAFARELTRSHHHVKFSSQEASLNEVLKFLSEFSIWAVESESDFFGVHIAIRQFSATSGEFMRFADSRDLFRRGPEFVTSKKKHKHGTNVYSNRQYIR